MQMQMHGLVPQQALVSTYQQLQSIHIPGYSLYTNTD